MADIRLDKNQELKSTGRPVMDFFHPFSANSTSASTSASTTISTSNKTVCDLVRSVFSFAEVDAAIDGISTVCPESGLNTPRSSLEDNADSCAETVVEACGDDDFDRAYRQYSRTSHMGILDPSYDVFTSRQGYGALVYKVKHRTLVVAGDPLCPPAHFQPLLEELRGFRKAHDWKIAFMNVGEAFAEYARKQGWATMHFGRERVVNPLTNAVLCKGAGKRIISRNRQLLDPDRCGVTVAIYAPSITGVEPARETELQNIYDEWRRERNRKHATNSQAFVTVYDLFSRPDVTLFVYTSARDGRATGFAALRSLGAHRGFQLDPCVASPSAPPGITDLLVVLAMALLRRAGVAYLSLGYEPFADLGEVSGRMRTGVMGQLARGAYHCVMQSVPLGGKKAYNDKFRPDEALTSNLYIVLPSRGFSLWQAAALMHVANIKIRKLIPRRS